MLKNIQEFVRTKTWLATILCIIPVAIYFVVFRSVALNVNYIAFDDIQILRIIPGFEGASWSERWKRLTELFPEHRLVFSRSVILFFHRIFGTINLIWLMTIANVCWAACGLVFYKAFRRLNLSLWYFVPVMWLWFSIQSFENMFWGVSSLCNFGVLLFVLGALYVAVFRPQQYYLSLLFAVFATFSYGNGLMIFPVIAVISWLAGRRRDFVFTLVVAAVIAAVYFTDFKPITQNLDLSNPKQVKDGFLGFFGFVGSIATIEAYNISVGTLRTAVAIGFLFVGSMFYLYRNQLLPLWNAVQGKKVYSNGGAMFAFGIVVFVAITALAIVYKRIPVDGFDGMFKGRYRMYSALWCIAFYFGLLSLTPGRISRVLAISILLGSIFMNLIILHSNFDAAVNNRRAAIVQEFNARYNADWWGLRMFGFDGEYFEKIRRYYKSDDPLAEGWNPRSETDTIGYVREYPPDTFERRGEDIVMSFGKEFFSTEKDFSDGAYAIFKSIKHTYAAAPTVGHVPLRTSLRRFMYFGKGAYISFHTGPRAPGSYRIYLLIRKNGVNSIYSTGKTWEKE